MQRNRFKRFVQDINSTNNSDFFDSPHNTRPSAADTAKYYELSIATRPVITLTLHESMLAHSRKIESSPCTSTATLSQVKRNVTTDRKMESVLSSRR